MRDRTADLLRAKQALSQLSYSPIAFRESVPWMFPACTPHVPQVFHSVPQCFTVFHRFSHNLSTAPRNEIGDAVVGLGGFEPPTSPLSGVRSNQLSHRPMRRSPERNAPQPGTECAAARNRNRSSNQINEDR